MAVSFSPFVVIAMTYHMLVDVLVFWKNRLFYRWNKKPPREAFMGRLALATSFEEWEEVAFQLDELLATDIWRQNATSKFYDYRLIYERLQAIIEAREDEDILTLMNLLRSGLVRNLGNITAPRLYNKAYAGTKLLIEDYITQVALAVEYVTSLPTSESYGYGLSSQAKLDVLHDTRQAFGRSTLVLQGGSIFGLCHLGVVKALHLRGLLPRIITGTATGALIAALVGIHTEDELLDFLSGDAIDLSAFEPDDADVESTNSSTSWLSTPMTLAQTLSRRVKRFIRSGYFMDVSVLEACVRANVGDLTFEDAFKKTKRVLNITVSPQNPSSAVPTLLNYLTAPNVLIWSAALASNATASSTLYHPVTLFARNEAGEIVPWGPAQETTFRPAHQTSYTSERESPLARIAELFNVNHFIVSQARPYIAPFLRSDLHHPSPTPRHLGSRFSLTLPLLRLLTLEATHRLHQLDTLGLLHPTLRRLLLDETIPGASLTLVPELNTSDFFRLLERPTRENMRGWILRGERSVWPAVTALRVRCAVEVELDRGYQVVRRKKPLDAIGLGGEGVTTTTVQAVNGNAPNGKADQGGDTTRKRLRAASAGPDMFLSH